MRPLFAGSCNLCDEHLYNVTSQHFRVVLHSCCFDASASHHMHTTLYSIAVEVFFFLFTSAFFSSSENRFLRCVCLCRQYFRFSSMFKPIKFQWNCRFRYLLTSWLCAIFNSYQIEIKKWKKKIEEERDNFPIRTILLSMAFLLLPLSSFKNWEKFMQKIKCATHFRFVRRN